MTEPVWLAKLEVLAIHDRQLAEHGGAAGIRDTGLLESAIARAQQLYAYGESDIFDLAAAYTVGIVRNHPFIDGNKRTAFMTGFVFLARNGKQLSAPEAETTQAILDLTAGTMTETAFTHWLRKNCEA